MCLPYGKVSHRIDELGYALFRIVRLFYLVSCLYRDTTFAVRDPIAMVG